MYFRLGTSVLPLALLLAVSCGARSTFDMPDELTDSTGGGLGSGGYTGPLGSGGQGGTTGSDGPVGTVSGGGGNYYGGGAGGQAGFGPGGSPVGGKGGTAGGAGGAVVGGRGGAINAGGSANFGGTISTGGWTNSGGTITGGTTSTGGRTNTSGTGGTTSTGGRAGGAAGFSGPDGGFGGRGGMAGGDGGPEVRTGGAGGNADSGVGGTIAMDGSTCPGLASNEELIDDLNDGDRFIPSINGRVGAWSDSHDNSPNSKMYPDPNTGFVPTDTGDACRKFAAYVYGGGYVISGASFWFGLGSPYDASKYKGISFWAKIDSGATSVVRVAFPDKDTQPDANICQSGVTSGSTACLDHYLSRVTLTTTWTKYTVSFSQLLQEGWGHTGTAFDPASLYQVQFQIPVNATFGVWIDDVAFTM